MNFYTSIKGVTKLAAAAGLAVLLVAAQPAVTSDTNAYAQGPASVADLAEGLMSAVVNISTSQKVSVFSSCGVSF